MRFVLFVIVIFIFASCSIRDENLSNYIVTPENIRVYDIKIDTFMEDINHGKELLDDFPFVSHNTIIDFKGKFSYQFYDKIDYRYRATSIDKVDFWKLRTNPFMYDFIYMLPIWVENLKRVSNDLYENIGYTYNLSSKEQEILKWWVAQGGILWLESGLYSTRYDTFKKNGDIDERAIRKKIINKSKNLHFFDRKIFTYSYRAPSIDYINYKEINLDFKVKSKIKYFSDIKTLKIKNSNYLSLYFLPKSSYLLEDKNSNPLVSFIRKGKGGVVFLRDFEFINKRYDGELFRWKLLFYLLNKVYLKDEKKKKTINKFDENKIFILKNLEFKYKSYLLTNKGKNILKPIITYLKEHKKYKILVSGHTDNIGSLRYNEKLSMKRTQSVKKVFISYGIDKDRIFTIGYGEEKPIFSNKTKEGRSKNRRVEFQILR